MRKQRKTEMMDLPQDCITKIIQSTTPKDACRISSTAKIFRSIADSHAVWLHFLPSDHLDLISGDEDSKKQAYLRLAGAGILIDGGAKHFSIDRATGKKRLIIGAKSLHITWGDKDECWRWGPVLGSRFVEIPELEFVWWLEIRTRELSPGTNYGAFLVFKMAGNKGGFVTSADVAVEVMGEVKKTRSVYLDVEEVEEEEREEAAELPAERGDGWLEVPMGEFFVGNEEREVEVSLMEIKGLSAKYGLVVEGIEFRPK